MLVNLFLPMVGELVVTPNHGVGFVQKIIYHPDAYAPIAVVKVSVGLTHVSCVYLKPFSSARSY